MKIIPAFKQNSTTLIMNCSEEYVPYMDVCLESVLDCSSKKHNYDVIVFETTISQKNKAYLTAKYSSDNFKIRFYNPSGILGLNLIHDTMPNYSKESFYKIIVPRLLKKYKKVIYADVDIIFQCDISEIQNTDIGDCPIAATRDFGLIWCEGVDSILENYLKSKVAIRDRFDYFSAGLIVYDIEKITEDDVKNMLKLAHENHFKLQEQDLFNKYFNSRIFELPYQYCVNTAWMDKLSPEFFEGTDYLNEYIEAKNNPKALHYSGEKKPWHRIKDDGYEQIWWAVAKKSRFYNTLNFQIPLSYGDNNMKNDNLALFIIWEKARYQENEILNRISNEFRILKKFAISWAPDKFHDNIYSFGGGCLVNSNFHEYHKGKGEFLMVLVKDEHAKMEERKTAQGFMPVNKNVFDFKYRTRAELLNNMCSFHAANNIKETRHDFALLTNQSLDDFIENNNLDGETVVLHQNLPCVDGWKSLDHIFYILNETVGYAVLRNFNGLPDEVVVDEHTDIDILVDDMQNFIAVLEGSKLREDVFKIRVYANINGQPALFHCKYIGDDYYDRIWEKRILQTRVLNEKGIYIPDDENYFYSLLYHALYQKTYVSDTYQPVFKKFMNGDTGLPALKKTMEKFLRDNNYKITEPYENLDPELHVSDTLLGRVNIDDVSLIDEKNEYYITRGKNAVSIFNKNWRELITERRPVLCCMTK